MNSNVRVAIISGGVIVIAVVAFILVAIAQNQQPGPVAAPTPAPALSEDSHILQDAGEDAVTVVEFLDFECEACGAFYPVVEGLRAAYAGEVTFGIRYFPLPSHYNSRNAAVAVEAAAQQGQLEAMYSRLFQTQSEWGEAQESRATLFRQFAEEIGLDMADYDAAIADPATLQRVKSDYDEGVSLGVSSTPTFFVNDQMVQMDSFDDLQNAIEAELNG